MAAKKLFSYYRSATDTDPTRFTLQVASCMNLIQAVGGIPVAESFDIGSGMNPRLPGYLRLLAAIAAREVDAVVASTADRFSRDPIQVHGLLDRCQLYGVEIWIACGGGRLHTGYLADEDLLGQVGSNSKLPMFN